MDTETLVSVNIPNGLGLVERLRRDGFHVGAAFWAKEAEPEGGWYLYLVSKDYDERGPVAAYTTVVTANRALPVHCRVYSPGVKLISPSDKAARVVSDLLAKSPKGVPIHNGWFTVGGVNLERSYIYPADTVDQPAADA